MVFEIDFKLRKSDIKLKCFTTRVDTIFGATYMVLAPEHPLTRDLIKDSENKKNIKLFIEEVKKESVIDRVSTNTQKKGMFTGRYVINPVNNKKIPLFIANYVLMEYGTGAVMAVPAHDQRDFEFAKEYSLDIEVVIDNPSEHLEVAKMKEAYVEEGIMVNSGEFNGLKSNEAIEKIAKYMENLGIGRRKVHYKLRDWLISRQRYWGAPIPMVHCPECGVQPVKEQDLPVILPEKVKFKPQGESPLKAVKSFVDTKCPKCNKKAKREIDTMDTFVDSSWYFLRYLSPKDKDKAFDKDLVSSWFPIDQYIGGVEHAILHLMYSRFIMKVLYDLEYVGFKEPFARLFTQGMIIKNGVKMSKSKGNVVSPDKLIDKYGADSVRFCTLFIGPPEKDAEWNDRGIEGAWRFLNRVWRMVDQMGDGRWEMGDKKETSVSSLCRKTHLTIKKVTEDIEGAFHFNTALSAIMELVNEIYAGVQDQKNTPHDKRLGQVSAQEFKEAVKTVVVLLAPFVPHIAEEMWQSLGNEKSVFEESWPQYDETALAQEKITLIVQINGKVRAKIEVPSVVSEAEIKKTVLDDDIVKKWIEGKNVRKVIVVKNKLVNLVVN